MDGLEGTLLGLLRLLTFFMMTSYADIRSEATKSRVCSLTSYKSLTFPSAILGSPSMEVDNKTVSAIARAFGNMKRQISAPTRPAHYDCEMFKRPPNYGGVRNIPRLR